MAPSIEHSSNQEMAPRLLPLPPTTNDDSDAKELPKPGAIGPPSSVLHLTVFSITLRFEEVSFRVKVGPKGSNCCGGIPCLGSGGGGAGGKEKTILSGISGMVYPGEILAMLGPSGSGKTTLLTALGGRLAGKLSGKITYNGRPFTGPIKRSIGFVAQNDVLYPHLTVMETLVFAALLRLPGSLSLAKKVEHAESVLAELGLTKCRDSIVGGALVRGISGGEKKRVSIGQEMLVNPSLLLLDEPTSGLDSTTAQRILTTVKGLARVGRTIVTTIHQPSSRLYHMFDKVILLSDGCPIYHGQASAALDYFASIGFATSVTMNPADFLLDLANGIAPEGRKSGGSGGDPVEQGGDKQQAGTETDPKSVKEELKEAYVKHISEKLKSEISRPDVCCGFGSTYGSSASAREPSRSNGGRKSGDQWCTSWWQQFTVLLRRGLKERRHESFSNLRIFQVISVATLAGLLWWHSDPSHLQDRIALMFFYSIFWGFFPLYNAVFTFPQERAMLIKERSSGMYRLSSYFLARTAGDLPMELALPTAFVTITYWMGGLKPNPATFILSLLVVLLNVLVSQSLGLALGACLMEIKQATTLASVTTLVFLLAGGYYIQKIPPFIIWLKYLSFSYYSYKLLLGVQFNEGDTYECRPGVSCRLIDFPAVKSVGLTHNELDVSAMLLMMVGYRLIAYAALRRVQPK
ncbi:unnamed protein product [Victoria cruziana]